jgi:hypothetical protein
VTGLTKLDFEDSAANIKLNFGTTTNQDLVGVHVFTITATVATYVPLTPMKTVTGTF